MASNAATSRAFRAHTKPDEESWFVAPVVLDWWKDYVDSGRTSKEFAIPGTRVRASWAGDCARAIAYHVAGVEESNPITVADAWRFNVGQMVHDQVQAKIEAAFPGSVSEVKVSIGEHGSGHMDMWVVRADGRTVSVEIKTVNGTGFRRMVDARNPEGPRVKYVMQGALNAANHDPLPDELLIVVFSLECMSEKQASMNNVTSEYQKFSAQWTFTKEEYLDIAHYEQQRLERIVTLVDSHGPGAVPRMMPDPSLPQHLVVNPKRGVINLHDKDGFVVGTGHVWQCNYCSFQDHCDNDSRQAP